MARTLSDDVRSELSVSPRAAWVAFSIALVSLSISLAVRDRVSVWAATGIAAAIGIAATAIAARGAVRAHFSISGAWVAAAIGIGIAMAIATHVLYPIGVSLVPGLEEEVASLYRDLRAPPGPRAALPVLAAVVLAEELVFRGLLVALVERWGIKPSAIIVVATALYVVPQIAGGSLVLIALAASCGALWTWQRVVSGSMLVPLITHALWDVLVFVLVPLPLT
ncbi:MAG: CPBP family intramembrane metalloprotease [Myxococcota bacterium]|nr:CPBP family intramembrane metalloprotease [Myxococcota bacterium]